MSKRNQKDSSKSTMEDGSGSPPGTAVDFLFRTMIERESAPGKRRIRPKNVEDLLQADIQDFGSDEDPDFEVTKDKHHGESDVSINSDDDDTDDDVKESEEESTKKVSEHLDDSDDDDDSYDANFDKDHSSGSDDSENEESNSSDDNSSEDDNGLGSPVQKKSALRETLQKLNDTEFTPQRKKRRKKPKTGTATVNASNGKAKPSVPSKKSETGLNQNKKSKVSSKPKTSGDSKSKSEDLKPGKPLTVVSKKRKRIEPSKSNKASIKEELRSKKKRKHRSITDIVNAAEKSQKENRKEIDLGKPVCSACLGNKSDGSNEIVECDSCGISVHEVCYGVSDTLSVSSGSGSSCSTEPWFCDACKTGAKSISCELCPMKGGLFKETSFGRWVHLVCGLYTRQVALDENGYLSLVAIPYSKWGAHPCSVCENDRYARTGICIPCDAGMCKAYLHASCAQKHGLLSDPVIETPGVVETAEADPYYASCKLHTNRETARRRAKSCGILQEQLRIKREKKLSENLSPQERYYQNRIRRKLERIRFKVAIKQAHSYSPHHLMKLSSIPLGSSGSNFGDLASSSSGLVSVNTNTLEDQKKSRLLSTAAGVTGSFVRKAELMGLDLKALELEDKNTRIVANVKRKWNILPSLGVEFAAYYADREIRINKMSEQCEKLEKDNNELNDKQISLQCSYDTQCVNHQEMYEDTDKVREQLCGLSGIVKGLCPPGNKKLTNSLTGFIRSDLPGVRQRSPSHAGKSSRASPPKSSGIKKNKRKLPLSPITTPVGRLAIAQCSLCKKSDDQHLITRCDHCKKHYHLKCLDPPLTRMPKRSRLCGWMCSDCGEEEPEVEENNVDTEAPRSLRGRTKIRKPGKYRHSTESVDDDLKIIAETRKTDKRPSSTQVSMALTELKIEPGTTPVMTNGSVKSSNRRRSGSTSTANVKSVNISLSSPVILPIEMPITPEVNMQTKKEPVLGQFKTPSPLKSPVVKINSGENKYKSKKPKKAQEVKDSALPKIKKERKRKDKNPKDQVSNVLSSPTEKDGVSAKLANKKIKSSSLAKQKKGSNSAAGTPTKKLKDVISPNKKSKDAIPGGEKFDGEPKIKNKKKSRAKNSKNQKMLDISSGNMICGGGDVTNISINNEILPTTSVNKTEVIANGNLKPNPVKKRKSSCIPSASPLIGCSPTQEKEKSMPPKKRKRISSTPEELTNQLAVINAVANGTFNTDLEDKNGTTKHPDPSSGVIMQGIAPSQNQWINKGEEDHSIMKGHAMGSNSTGGEIVTVNANDLFDYVANSTIATTTSSCSYSPGFYSTPSTAKNISYVSSSLSHEPAAKYNCPNDGVASAVGLPMSSPWTQPQESQNQNVIKLHYESGSVVNVAPYSGLASSYTPSHTVSSVDGKCATCKNEDSRKFMVTCDKCAQDFHFMCLNPPLKYSPRRRGYSWYCTGCDDDSSTASGQENGINSP